ncbi:MAG TPA: hypothetical protein VFD17_01285 [Clostridia bacterium]|nr:hypothetical protein [Clostridia bacterium]
MKYFLAFVLLATFIARRKLVRMLNKEIEANNDLIDLVTIKRKPRK